MLRWRNSCTPDSNGNFRNNLAREIINCTLRICASVPRSSNAMMQNVDPLRHRDLTGLFHRCIWNRTFLNHFTRYATHTMYIMLPGKFLFVSLFAIIANNIFINTYGIKRREIRISNNILISRGSIKISLMQTRDSSDFECSGARVRREISGFTQ